jgi:hypothetical protein
MIPSLVEAAIRSIGVALIVGIGLRIFKVRNVLAQKAAWSLVLAAALVMPIVQSLPKNWRGHVPLTIHMPSAVWGQAQALPVASQATSLQSRAAAQQFQVEPAVSGGNRFPAPLVFQPDLNPAALSAEKPATILAAPRAKGFGRMWRALRQFKLSAIACFLYCAVFGVLVMRFGYGLTLAARIWHLAKPVALNSDLGFNSDLAVRSSLAVSSPVTVGSGVLLPADYELWGVEKLRIVLALE